MLNHRNSLLFLTIQVVLLFSSVIAKAQNADHGESWSIENAVQTDDGQQIPAGAYGIVWINTPRTATLLQLRGVAGRGTVILRSNNHRDCLSFPIRLVAGDFGGDGISAYTAKPIHLIIRTEQVANALRGGQDVVSDMYRISNQQNAANADIVIQSGLSDSHGFVLNPGSSVLADVFGANVNHTACSEL